MKGSFVVDQQRGKENKIASFPVVPSIVHGVVVPG
jgi:hypothetical protein